MYNRKHTGPVYLSVTNDTRNGGPGGTEGIYLSTRPRLGGISGYENRELH